MLRWSESFRQGDSGRQALRLFCAKSTVVRERRAFSLSGFLNHLKFSSPVLLKIVKFYLVLTKCHVSLNKATPFCMRLDSHPNILVVLCIRKLTMPLTRKWGLLPPYPRLQLLPLELFTFIIFFKASIDKTEKTLILRVFFHSNKTWILAMFRPAAAMVRLLGPSSSGIVTTELNNCVKRRKNSCNKLLQQYGNYWYYSHSTQ